MNPDFPLNTIDVHKWAAVAFGATWVRHTVNESGERTEERLCGPLVVWDVPKKYEELFHFFLKAMKKSDEPRESLEDYIGRLNSAPAFERFKWAAQGKVRHSRRWKSSRKSRRIAILIGFIRILLATRSKKSELSGMVAATLDRYAGTEFKTILELKYLIRFIEARAPLEGDTLPPMCVVNLIQPLRMTRFKNIRPNTPEEKVILHFESIVEGKPDGYLFEKELQEHGGKLLNFLADNPIILDLEAIFRNYVQKKKERFSALLTALAFDKAFWRAHLTRRVKPAPRRGRIRRPLYARPRPPSAPLAPPVS